MKKRLIFVLLLATLLLNNYIFSDNKCPRKPKVLISLIKQQTYNEYKSFEAEFSPEIIPLKSHIDGTITSIKVSENSFVSKDAPLFEFNNLLEDKIEKVRKNIKKWEKILWRREHWKVRSKAAENQAKRKINTYKLELEKLLKEKEKMVLKAPCDCFVEKIIPTTNSKVKKGDILLYLKRKDRYVSSLILENEKDLNIFKKNTSFYDKTKKFKIKVESIDPAKKEVILLIEEGETKNDPIDIKFSLLKKVWEDIFILSNKYTFPGKDENIFIYSIDSKGNRVVKLIFHPLIKGDNFYVVKADSPSLFVITNEIKKLKKTIKLLPIKCLKERKKVKSYIYNNYGVLIKYKDYIKGKKLRIHPPKLKEKSISVYEPERKIFNGIHSFINWGIRRVNDNLIKDIYNEKLFHAYYINFGVNVYSNFGISMGIKSFSTSTNIEYLGKSKMDIRPINIGMYYLWNYKNPHENTTSAYYVEGGAAIISVKESVEIFENETINKSTTGIYLSVGTHIKVYSNLFFNMDFRVTNAKLNYAINDVEQTLDLSGISITAGFGFRVNFLK